RARPGQSRDRVDRGTDRRDTETRCQFPACTPRAARDRSARRSALDDVARRRLAERPRLRGRLPRTEEVVARTSAGASCVVTLGVRKAMPVDAAPGARPHGGTARVLEIYRTRGERVQADGE